MKATFITRTGKGGGPSLADEIEKRLAEANLLPSRRKIPRSTLNRLLSAEPFRHRVGISMKSGRFQFTHDEPKSLAALARIAKDMAERTLVLGDIWDIDGKQNYLDQLEREGVLPDKKRKVTIAESTVPIDKPAKVKQSVKATPTVRTTLIAQKDFDLNWPGRLQRHHRFWEELQFHLDLRTHPNAISVLMRVLIELALENYIKEAKVLVYENDKLATRLEKAGLHLLTAGKIDAKQVEVLKKFKQGDKLVSADTLNKYVHSTNFAPSPEHLMSIWDSLADVVVEMLRA